MATSSISLRPTVERLVTHILHDVGIGANGQGIVVVRCGRLGACVGTKKGGLKWCPAYWEGDDVKNVKDVTGGGLDWKPCIVNIDVFIVVAGNSFLGGYVAGLSLTNDPYEGKIFSNTIRSPTDSVHSSFIRHHFILLRCRAVRTATSNGLHRSSDGRRNLECRHTLSSIEGTETTLGSTIMFSLHIHIMRDRFRTFLCHFFRIPFIRCIP